MQVSEFEDLANTDHVEPVYELSNSTMQSHFVLASLCTYIGSLKHPCTTYSGVLREIKEKKANQNFSPRHRLDTESGRDFPTGRQGRSKQGEQQHQNDHSEREEEPNRVETDQPRRSGYLFPRKHPKIILPQIKRDCLTGVLRHLLKRPLALLTNCSIPQEPPVTDPTQSDHPFAAHP